VDTFAAYSTAWLDTRSLRPRTRAEYRKLLDGHLLPTFGQLHLDEISPPLVRDWYAGLGTGRTPQGARLRAAAHDPEHRRRRRRDRLKPVPDAGRWHQ
jgi:Phage integrase, N-terminal SAM-like domain